LTARWWCGVVATALWSLTAPAQGTFDTEPAPNTTLGKGDPDLRGPAELSVDGQAWSVQRALYDPWGRLQVEATHADRTILIELRLPAFGSPLNGALDLATGKPPEVAQGPVAPASLQNLRAVAVQLDGKPVVWQSGTAAIKLARDGTLEMQLEGQVGGDPLVVAGSMGTVARRLEPVSVAGAPELSRRRVRVPQRIEDEDLVFCALGNTGTGLRGQKDVATAMARVSAAAHLDFVLLLGDVFVTGAPPAADPAWDEAFGAVYTDPGLDVPFYVSIGDRDHLGNIGSYHERAAADPRWRFPKIVYDFAVDCHGKKVLFVAADTTAMLKDIRNPETRHARRHLENTLRQEADWKIVFGHHPLVASGQGSDDADRAMLRRLAQLVQGADVYLSGGDHHLEVSAPIDGVVHVNSGGGGGPEAAGAATWSDHTRFAATGGGFVWLRCTGDSLEIVCRDSEGRPLHLERITRQ